CGEFVGGWRERGLFAGGLAQRGEKSAICEKRGCTPPATRIECVPRRRGDRTAGGGLDHRRSSEDGDATRAEGVVRRLLLPRAGAVRAAVRRALRDLPSQPARGPDPAPPAPLHPPPGPHPPRRRAPPRSG